MAFFFQPFVTLFNEGLRATLQRHLLFGLSIVIVGVLLLFGLLYLFVFREGPTTGPDLLNYLGGHQMAPDIREAFDQLDMDQAEWDAAQLEGRRQEEIAVAQYRVLCVDQAARRTREAVDGCQSEATLWSRELQAFQGEPIDWDDPANRDLLGHVEMLLALKTPSQEEVDALKDQLRVLTSPLSLSESGAVSPVSDTLESELESLDDRSEEMRQVFSRRRAMLRAIRSKTMGEAVPGEADDLGAALENHQLNAAGALQSRIDRQLSDAKQEHQAILDDVRQKAEQQLADAKQHAEDIDRKIETGQRESDADYQEELEKLAVIEQRRRTEQAELLRTFEEDLPDIRQTLHWFLTPTTLDPVNQTRPHKVPLSYSSLESSGVLKEGENGYGRICYLVAQIRDGKPRMYEATGSNPRLLWQMSRHKTEVMRMQAYLNRYGLLMVEKGMLTP